MPHPASLSHRRLLAATLAQTVSLTLAVAQPGLAVPLTDDELDRLLAVNAGELQFLTEQPATVTALTIHTVLNIPPQSLRDGWVGLEQCQSKLDPIAVAEIEYSYSGMRNLRIAESAGIERAWVDGTRVQLRGVNASARVCIAAEVQILRAADDHYELRIGPYHRRFLDGYFPVQLQIDLHYSADHLRWTHMQPPPQPGLSLRHEPGLAQIETRFTGRLQLQFNFVPVQP